MDSPLEDVCCASLPAAALARLGPLRVHPGLRVRLVGERAWLFWTPGDDRVQREVLPLHGAELFARRDGLWYQPGRRLPAFDVPGEEDAQPLVRALAPDPVRPEKGPGPAFARARLGLVRDDVARPAAALDCPLAEVVRWAEMATSRQLASIEGACAADRVLLRGAPLPALPRGVEGGPRPYWGRTVLVPLGFRPDPDLAEGVLVEALGLERGEVALLTPGGAEVIPAGIFRPLTRAGLRLAARGMA